MKIIESYKVKDKFMKTPIGDIEILFVHKTIKYDIFEIILENGLKLQGSGEHSVITSKGFEIKLKHSLGVELATIYGAAKVISIKFIKHDHCFDVTLKDFHLYYTNGILSHNSGKSVTSGLYLLWIANFTPNINIGIAGNKLDLAMEVLDKIKKIFIELPMWMKQGIEAWNKTYIQFENGTRILTSATSGDSFRGHSCIGGDEIIQVYDTHENIVKYMKIYDILKVLKNEKTQGSDFKKSTNRQHTKRKNKKLYYTQQFLSNTKKQKR